MSQDKPKMKVEFAPGCFDDFEGTQEELEEFQRLIQAGFESGDFLEESEELTDEMFAELSEEDQERILAALDGEIDRRRRLQ
jgi:hypothetical protein